MYFFAEHYPLISLNTMRLKSTARYYARVSTEHDLQALLNSVTAKRHPLFVLGSGSNILLAEQVNALVVQLDLQGITLIHETNQHVWIRAKAGEHWNNFVQHTLVQGWYGLENLSLIPGTVGACPIQNIGAYGVEVKDVIEQVTAFDKQTGQRLAFSNEQCLFGYRDSVFKQSNQYIVTEVVFRLSKSPNLVLGYGDVREAAGLHPTPVKVAQVISHIRSQKLPDPAVIANTGSFFKNPIIPNAHAESLKQRFPQLPIYPMPDHNNSKIAAGWLIEQSGWKGKKLEMVGMFERQALVMVNYGGADLSHIIATEQAVQQSVFEKFNIQLEREPIIVC